MKDVITAAAQALTGETGARLVITPGIAYNTADAALHVIAGALLNQVQGTGIELLALHRKGGTLVAHINDDLADEPLCPAAFHRVVRRLSHDLLGQVWDGLLMAETLPTPGLARQAQVA